MEFSITALRLAFLLQKESLGRRRLADRTGLSEMIVRLELEQLRKGGLVRLDRRGCHLTDKGLRAFSPILRMVVNVASIELSGLQIDVVNLAAHLNSREQVPAAWALRDDAIREGASGLILLSRCEGEWIFSHDQEPVRINYLSDANQLEQRFCDVNSDDLLLIVSGPNRDPCAQGLWRAIRTLSKLPH